MAGKSNLLLYSTSLCKFPEFIDLPLSFYQNHNDDYQNLSKSELNKKYFNFLLNIIPNILKTSATNDNKFFNTMHYIFLRYPDAFKNELKLEFENIYPSYQPPKIEQYDRNKLYAFPLTVGEINKLLPVSFRFIKF